MKNFCLLCGESNIKVVDIVSSLLIKKLYKMQYNINILSLNNDFYILYDCTNCSLKFFSPTIPGDENLYEQLQQHSWYYLDDKDEYNTARKYISHTDNILEVGSGRGFFSKNLRCQSYKGLEFSAAAILLAKEEGIEIIKESVEFHAIENEEKYDIVCAFQVLEHVENPAVFIRSCIKTLKKNGKLIFSIPSDDAFIGFMMNNVLNMPPHHMTRWTDTCLRNIATLFEMKLIAVEHEILSDLHVPVYANSIIEEAFRQILRMKKKTLNPYFLYIHMRLLVKIFSYLPKKGLSNKSVRPVGHSVTVIYEKI